MTVTDELTEFAAPSVDDYRGIVPSIRKVERA